MKEPPRIDGRIVFAGFISFYLLTVFFLGLIMATNRRVDYPHGVLWGLTLWAGLHMAGGGFFIGDTLLYQVILVPVSAEYGIFRFDQFVHIVGFGVHPRSVRSAAGGRFLGPGRGAVRRGWQGPSCGPRLRA